MGLGTRITLFVACMATVIGMFIGGFYLMAVYIPPAVEAFVKAFAQ